MSGILRRKVLDQHRSCALTHTIARRAQHGGRENRACCRTNKQHLCALGTLVPRKGVEHHQCPQYIHARTRPTMPSELSRR